MLDSVTRANKNYDPHTLLEECKCEKKITKMENLITNDLDSSWYDESNSESDGELDSELDNDKSSD